MTTYGRDGGEMSEHSATHAATRAFHRAGISGATLHDLRRTCGSLLLSRGVPLIVVSRHLGHATPQVTATVCAHLLRDSQLAAVPAAFEEAFASPSMAGTMAGRNGHP